MGKPLGGSQFERRHAHTMHLMVMPSNVISCWRRLRQPRRSMTRLRLPSRAGVTLGKVICSCPMPSNLISCWRGLRQPCRGLMRLQLRSCAGASAGREILACPLIAVSVLPPNRRLQLTPLRGRKIRAILKSRLGSTAFRSIDAAQLKRNTLGGFHQALRYLRSFLQLV